MSNQRDKTSIFLTVVIIFLIVAMAVYAFIYRERIAETIENFTKKTPKVEKQEIYTKIKSDEKKDFSDVTSKDLPSKRESSHLDFLDSPKKEEKNLKFLEPEKTSKPNSPTLSELEPKYLEPESTYKPEGKLEFTNSKQRGKKSKFKKGKHYKTRKLSLEKRVRRLEKKLGVRPKKGNTLAKRVTRLEKIVAKKKL
jgi:hypothetical protein